MAKVRQPGLTTVHHVMNLSVRNLWEDKSLFRTPDIDQNEIYFSKEERQVGWVKFEAPADADWPIDLSLPGVSPFTISQPAE